MKRDHIIFYLNGNLHYVKGDQAFFPLSTYLRFDQQMTGTKVVCAEGDCGACSVLIAYPAVEKDFKVVNSCILPVYALDGASVVSIEGLNQVSGVNEIQKQMMECHGSQCGFCTPGFVVSLQNMCEQNTKISAQKIKNYTTGNLCRCTGYEAIVKAGMEIDLKKVQPSRERYLTAQIQKHLKNVFKDRVEVRTNDKWVVIPNQTNEVSSLLKKNPKARLVSSATDLGVLHNKEKIDLFQVISLHHLTELFQLENQAEAVYVGAKVSITQFQQLIQKDLAEFASYLNIFASLQIRNQASLVGNVANASPIGDSLPVLMALGAEVEIMGGTKKKWIPLDEFYTGYRQMKLSRGEWIKAIKIPKLKKGEKLANFKISNRRDLDISTVNASFVYKLNAEKIEKIKIAFGGVAATTIRLKKTENLLLGKAPHKKTWEQANLQLQQEITPISDVRASSEYRRQVSSHILKQVLLNEMNT